MVGPSRIHGLTVSLMVAMAVPAIASPAAPANRTPLHGSLTPTQARSHPAGSVAAASPVSFDLVLSLQNASGAQAFLRAVSSPGSATFHHYLTDAQWASQFGPTQAQVAAAESWLHQEGFTVGSVPQDRLFVPASGSAKSVAQAFGATFGYYMVNGHKLRLAKSTLTIPSSLASVVSNVVGVNQNVMTTSQEPGAARRVPQSPAMLGVLGAEDRHQGLGLALCALHRSAALRHLRLQARSAQRRLQARRVGGLG